MCGVFLLTNFVSRNTSSFRQPSLITITIMPPMGSNDHMDWLPGLGTQSHNSFDLASAPRAKLETGHNTKAANRVFDEVQYSIVCHDCGKNFWRRSTADSHAALTTHVLHEDTMSPSSPVIVPISPATSWATAPRTNTPLNSLTETETSLNADFLDHGYSEDIGDEEYSVCFDCGKHFWSYEAASNHARIGHMQDTEIVPSSVPDESPTLAATDPAVTPTFPAASPGTKPTPLFRKTGPDTASPPGVGGKFPTSASWTSECTSSRGFSPTSPTSAHGITSPTSGHATALFREKFAHPTVPNVSQRVCMLTKRVCC